MSTERYHATDYPKAIAAHGARFVKRSNDGKANLFQAKDGRWIVVRQIANNVVEFSFHASESDCGCGG